MKKRTLIDHNKFGLTDEVVKQIKGIVLDTVHPDKIFIYGSRARGNYKDNSDIDVAVDSSNDIGHVGVFLNEDVRTLKKIDIVNIRNVNKELRSNILKEGVKIYEKV